MQIPNQLGVEKDDIKMTREEFKKIEVAMKKPEFGGLVNDYMLEISDPKNRAEYDEYLQQLDRDKELPKGMKLVKPDTHFCIKTSLWSKNNKKHEQKFFINICSSSVVDQPSYTTVTQNGQTGQSWQIPFTIGKIRYDQDKKGVVCNTVEVAFHPLTIGYSHKIAGYQALVCGTAIDASQKQLGERNEDVSKDYKVLKHTKCKGGEPALLPIRLGKKGKASTNKTELDDRQGGQQNAQTKLQRDINAIKTETTQEEQSKQVEEEEEVFKESDEIDSVAVQQPKFRFIYSYPVDYGDFLDSRINPLKKLPNQLGCDIKLPKVQSIADINLDLSNANLLLDVQNKYFLDIKLPYPVESGEGTAKFESKQRTLKVRVPIEREYLKRKYQEELDEISKSEPAVPEEEIKFIPVAENFQETQQQLIEEIESKNVDDQDSFEIIPEQPKQQIPVEQRIQYAQLSYRTRVDSEYCFIIINLKNYQREGLTVLFTDREILVYYTAEVNDIQQQYFLHCKTGENEFITKQSNVDYVTDFIVLKLKRNTTIATEVPILETIDYTECPFNQFIERIDQLKQEQQESEPEELEIPTSKEQSIGITQQGSQINKNIDYSENPDEDDESNKNNEVPLTNEVQLNNANAAPQQQSVQFINFQSVLPEAFDID